MIKTRRYSKQGLVELLENIVESGETQQLQINELDAEWLLAELSTPDAMREIALAVKSIAEDVAVIRGTGVRIWKIS